jgi:hypothetical protein
MTGGRMGAAMTGGHMAVTETTGMAAGTAAKEGPASSRLLAAIQARTSGRRCANRTGSASQNGCGDITGWKKMTYR